MSTNPIQPYTYARHQPENKALSVQGTIRALWDPEREAIVSIYTRDRNGTILGDPRPTGIPVNPNVELEEKNFRSDSPENFIERFGRLLGVSQAHLDPEDPDTVVMVYPDADFSEGAVREELKRMARDDANKILGATDWYVVRKAETKKAIPQEIRDLRQAIRDEIGEIEEAIDGVSGQELITYTWEFKSVPDPHDQHPSPRP